MSFLQQHGVLQQTVKKSVLINAANQSLNYGTAKPFSPDILDTDTAFSFSCWWKPSDITDEGNFFSTILPSFPFRGISLSNRGGTLNRLRIYMIDDAFPGDTLRTDFNHSMVNGTWYHVVFTYDGGQDVTDCAAYVNGVSLVRNASEDLNTLSGPAITTSNLTLFNGDLLGGSLLGNFTSITWWNKQLSAAEVTALYNLGKPPNPRTLAFASNLIQWIRIDEDVLFFPSARDSQLVINPTYTNIPITNITADVP